MTAIDWAAGDMAPVRALILAESDRRDHELGRQLAAWRDGWTACQAALGDSYEEGFTDGLMALKAAQHDLHAAIRLDEQMWGPGGRARFADPRPGDYTGSST